MIKLGDDFFGKLLLLIVGFGLTGVLGSYVSYKLAILQRSQVALAEQAALRAKNGVEIEDLALRETADLVQKLREARSLALNKSPEEALVYYKNTFLPVKVRWDREIYQLRNQVGRSFGADAALLIYDPKNRIYDYDVCGVFGDREREIDLPECSSSLNREVSGLDSVIAALNRGMVSGRDSFGINWPSDFTTSFRASHTLLYRMIDCKQGPGSENAKRWGSEKFNARCSNIQKLSQNLNQRVNLTGVAQEALADQFLAVWTTDSGITR
jgi:hypothetical protein